MDPYSYENLLFLSTNIQSAQEQIPTDIKQEISQVLQPLDTLLHIQIVSQQRNQQIKFDLFDSTSLKLLQNKIQANLKAAQSSLKNNNSMESKTYIIQCLKHLYQQQILIEQKQSLQNECKKNLEIINNIFITKKQRTAEENQSNLNALKTKQAEEAILKNQQLDKYQIDNNRVKQKQEELDKLQNKQATSQPFKPQNSSDSSVEDNKSKAVNQVTQKKETSINSTAISPLQNNIRYKYKCAIFLEKKEKEKYKFADVSIYILCSFSSFWGIVDLSPQSFLKELNAKLKGYSLNEISHLIFILPNSLSKKLSDSHNDELLVLLRQIKLIKPQVLTIVDQYNNEELCLQIQRGVGIYQKVKILNQLTQRDISETVNEQITQEQIQKNQLNQQIIEQRKNVLQKQAQSLENERKQQLIISKQAQESKEQLNNNQQNQRRINELKKEINEINNSKLPSLQDIEQQKKKFQADQNQCIEELKEAQMDKQKEFERGQTILLKYLGQVQIDSNMSDTYFSQVKDLIMVLERKELQLQKILYLIDQKECVGLLLKLSKNLQIFTSDEFISLDVIIQGLIDKLTDPLKQQIQENLLEKLKAANLLDFFSSVGEDKASQETELSKSIKYYVEAYDLEKYFNSLNESYDNQAERIGKARDILETQVA